MTVLPTKACWLAENVAPVISNEALEGTEGVFLATHTPISGIQVFGSHAGEIMDRTERGVLNALAAPGRLHAFCVVQGEPGSGKSHLIRWLSVNWPVQTDVKLLLQRDDGSLQGALRQLRQALPPEFEELFSKLGQRHRAGERGRANIFLGNLANALNPTHFDPPLDDAEWCAANLPGELLFYKPVRDAWTAPQRILTLIEGAERSRNSETASFNIFDIESLANCSPTERNSGLPLKAQRLADRLQREADTIREHREAGWNAEEVERELKGRLRASFDLMDGLNRRRNDAIQQVLGVSAQGLKDLFRQVRRELAQRGQRLILLLEDITSWEGIDDSLIDVLVTNADTREEDMSPLISVVGVTPLYYQRLHGNYRGRITHELRLGDGREGELQDVATLRRPEDRRAFVARYLAAVRAGVPALKTWRETVRDFDREPPNVCSTCPAQPGCHAVFGEEDGVGVFPFTPRALETMFQALNDHDNGLTWKTPRGILQGILSPSLSQPTAIEAGAFPTALVDGAIAFTPESRHIAPRVRQVLEARAEDQETFARLRRLISFWGNKERADTTGVEGREALAFAEVHEGVFKAFGLPWTGEARATSSATITVDAPALNGGGQESGNSAEQSGPQDARAAESDSSKEPRGRGRGGPLVQPPQTTEQPPSRRNKVAKGPLERERGQLRTWAETGRLDNPSYWNGVVFSLLSEIDPRSLGLDPYSFQRLFTSERIKIEGTTAAQRAYLLLNQGQWLVEGLEAYAALRLDDVMSGADAEFHRQRLARLIRRLTELASDYADRRLTLLENGSRWSPPTAIAQVLLARAWLRGVVSPDAPIDAQFQAVLGDETEAETDQASRSKPWRDFLTATHPWQQRYREALNKALSLSQGRSSGFGMVDSGVIAGALLRLRTTLTFDPVPDGASECGVEEFEKLPELLEVGGSLLSGIVRTERVTLQNRAEALRPMLRGFGIRAHIERLDRAITQVSEQLPQAVPARVQDWKKRLLTAQSIWGRGGDEAVENLLLVLSEGGEGPPSARAPLLWWLAQAPAKDLEEARSLADLGESVVKELLPPVRDCVADAGKSGSLSTIHEAGHRLAQVLARTEEKA